MNTPDPPENFPLAYHSPSSRADHSVAPDHVRSGQREPFCFLQASDFRLDTPCYGVLNLPDELRDRFVDARYIAAERVFDAAIQHDVDFLVLAGGLLDARLPGLRGPWFLSEQFRRLADHGIDIYWAGSTFETRDRWPAHAEIPANVRQLSVESSGIVHRRQDEPVARLLSIPPGKLETFQIGESLDFTIAVQPRTTSVPQRWNAGIDYWALGGQSHHETEQVGEVVAHFAGSPQGRSPAESGRHSCSLIHVDASGKVQIDPLATNVVRWHHEYVRAETAATWSALEQQLQQAQAEFALDSAAEIVLIQWTVSGSGLAVQRLLEPEYHAQLLGCLNAEQSRQNPARWTIGIDVRIDASDADAWQKQQTTLGAFLRELQEMSGQVEQLCEPSEASPHAGEQGAAVSGPHLLEQVSQEGVQRLGTNDPCTTTQTE